MPQELMTSFSNPHSPPIFIVGTPRAGTTLLARILNLHPKMYSPGETHCFEEIWPGREPNIQDVYSGELKHAAIRIYTALGTHRFHTSQEAIYRAFSLGDMLALAEQLGGGYRGLYSAFYSLTASSTGADLIVDDTPRHLFHIHEIRSIFPGSKFIGIVRDPRDFLASYKNLWKITSPEELTRIRSLYHPVVTSYYWRSANSLLLEHHQTCCRDYLHLLRYEDLVQDPEAAVKAICAFIEVEYKDEMLAVDNRNSSFEGAGRGIYSTSMGRWRTALQPHEQWIAQRVNRGNMSRLHYQPEIVPFSPGAIFLSYLSAPFALLRTFWTNRQRRGPLPAYLLRRLRGILRRTG